MAVRTADAQWGGDLKSGNGTMRLGSGAFEGEYSFRTRMLDGTDATNPEELIGAAHAGCFSMALSAILSGAGHIPTRVHTSAKVHFDQVEGGFAITGIDLTTDAIVPGIDQAEFEKHAEAAKAGCPVSKALAAVPIALNATLTQG